MKKVMLAVMVLSAVVNGAYANGTNNLVGGTDNVATANSDAVFGYKNTVNSNNAIAFGENNTVNGSQLHAAYDAINTMSEDIDKALDAQQQFNTAVHNTLANHKDAIKNNTQRIAQHDADIANNKNAIKANDRVLKNHEERIDKLEHQASNTLTNLKADIKQLDGRINKVGASAAALAGLHPMEFNKDDKFSTSVAYGHYKNANAVALGAYYRPNEKVLLGIAGTFGSENMYNVSASFKFGKHSEYEPQAKRDGEIEAMKAQIAELTARLDAVSK